jgi:hypothetical protein
MTDQKLPVWKQLRDAVGALEKALERVYGQIGYIEPTFNNVDEYRECVTVSFERGAGPSVLCCNCKVNFTPLPHIRTTERYGRHKHLGGESYRVLGELVISDNYFYSACGEACRRILEKKISDISARQKEQRHEIKAAKRLLREAMDVESQSQKLISPNH